MNRTRYLCTTAIGIALYCALSMSMKIPLGIGHIVIDLGYIVFAVYAYYMGSISAAIVGGASAAIMSVLSGWFSLEWVLANIVIGVICGRLYKRSKNVYIFNMAVTIVAVAIGMLIVKTAVSCWLFSIPILVKLPKSVTAWVTDSVVMCIGISIVPKLGRVFKNEKIQVW